MRFLVAILGGFALLLAGCDASEESRHPVEVTVFGSQDPEALWEDTLATFQSSWKDPISLGNTPKVRFEIPASGRYEIRVVHEEADQKAIHVFEASRFEDESRVSIYDRFAHTPEHYDEYGAGKSERQPEALENPEEPRHIIHRLFFLEGIGDKPSSPLEVIYVPLNDNDEAILGSKTVWVDPEEHTLSSDASFRVSRPDLPIASDETIYSQYDVDFESQNQMLQPLAVWRQNSRNHWSASSDSDGSFGFYQKAVAIGEGFEFLLYTVDGSAMK